MDFGDSANFGPDGSGSRGSAAAGRRRDGENASGQSCSDLDTSGTPRQTPLDDRCERKAPPPQLCDRACGGAPLGDSAPRAAPAPRPPPPPGQLCDSGNDDAPPRSAEASAGGGGKFSSLSRPSNASSGLPAGFSRCSSAAQSSPLKAPSSSTSNQRRLPGERNPPMPAQSPCLASKNLNTRPLLIGPALANSRANCCAAAPARWQSARSPSRISQSRKATSGGKLGAATLGLLRGAVPRSSASSFSQACSGLFGRTMCKKPSYRTSPLSFAYGSTAIATPGAEALAMLWGCSTTHWQKSSALNQPFWLSKPPCKLLKVS
mmetsp:Transcript_91024/g.260456  ORF Transcript_91024/g.260456 Transcript_91024/m.260456 type:complete len:320 (-) Transcript_91024:60-1019(-)